jgi:hypothetical protein
MIIIIVTAMENLKSYNVCFHSIGIWVVPDPPPKKVICSDATQQSPAAANSCNQDESTVSYTKKMCSAMGMVTSGVMFLCDNARLYTAAQTRALLEHFN